MNFSFGPQPGQILFFHGAPPDTAVTVAPTSPTATERTDYNSPSPMGRFAFASHRTFIKSHASESIRGSISDFGRESGAAFHDKAMALCCSREYRVHLHQCHGELSRLYGRLESGDMRDNLDPMDSALMGSVARTVRE